MKKVKKIYELDFCVHYVHIKSSHVTTLPYVSMTLTSKPFVVLHEPNRFNPQRPQGFFFFFYEISSLKAILAINVYKTLCKLLGRKSFWSHAISGAKFLMHVSKNPRKKVNFDYFTEKLAFRQIFKWSWPFSILSRQVFHLFYNFHRNSMVVYSIHYANKNWFHNSPQN